MPRVQTLVVGRTEPVLEDGVSPRAQSPQVLSCHPLTPLGGNLQPTSAAAGRSMGQTLQVSRFCVWPPNVGAHGAVVWAAWQRRPSLGSLGTHRHVGARRWAEQSLAASHLSWM